MSKLSPNDLADKFDEEGRYIEERVMQAEQLGLSHSSKCMVCTGNDYLIQGLLNQGTIAMIFGPSNSGKSFLALDIAAHLATGNEWMGRKVKHSNILYVALEGRNGLDNRICGLAKVNKIRSNSGFFIRTQGVNLFEHDSDVQELIEQANWVFEHSYLGRAIFIDTLAMATVGASENDGRDMGVVLEKIRWIKEETGAMVLLVHHAGKDISRGARGHSSIRGALDTELELIIQEQRRYLKATKQRDHEGGIKIPFSLSTIELAKIEEQKITTKVIEPAKIKDLKANDAIVEILKQGQMTQDELYNEFKLAKSWSNTKSQYSQALKALLHKRLVREDGDLLKLN